ncbi:CHAT domain-containing protein [Lactarius hengduanensis]|nr:CHAT domain-containing protein [Lactarius hengduanensis]
MQNDCGKAIYTLFRAYQSAEEQGEPAFGNWIANAESLLSSCPRSHHGRPYLLAHLASAKTYRDNMLRRSSDLDDIILYLTEALLFPFRVVDGTPFKVVDTFCLLACTLVRRFECSRQPSDLESGIKYFRFLLHLPLRHTDTQISRVSAELANALSFKTGLDPTSEHDNIEEVLSLYLYFSPWDPSEEYTVSVLSRLALAVVDRLSRTGKPEYCERVVGYLREGRKLCRPKDHPELAVLLAISLTWHSSHTGTEDSYQEMTALYNEYLPLLPSGHYLQPLARLAMGLAATVHSKGGDESDGHDEAINCCRATLNCFPPGSQYRTMCLHVLAVLLRGRYEHFGREECLREADFCTEEALTLYESENLRSLRDSDGGLASTMLSLIHANASTAALEEEIQYSHERLSGTQPGQIGHRHALRNSHLVHLMKFSRTNETADLEEAINHHRMLLSSTPNTYKDEVDMARNLQLAFLRSGRGELLEKSINICRDVLKTHRQASHARLFAILGESLALRCLLLGHLESVNEPVSMYKAAFEAYANASDKFRIACFWAHFSRAFKHSSTSLAYQNALSVMQSTLTGPTVQTQHVIIRNLGNHMQIPLDYASFLIERGQLEMAIEMLEQGRALLWSEMRGLRTPVDQLRNVDPTLADKFRDVSQALEAVTTSISLHENSETPPGTERGHEETDTFSHTLKEQRRVLQDRQEIISQIRKLSGFESFLKAVPFHTLRNAASGGPIVIVNHCRWRCDIVIVLKDAAPSLIPTPREFYERANTLADRLLNARKKHALESKHYHRALRSVLEELHELVGQPIVDRLRELRIPEQSRVWWCPTSVFCSLPLHAMGPIPSDGHQKRYFSELYVSSYTPTLGALIASRANVSQTSDSSASLLMVGQPDAYLQGVKGEMDVVRAVGIPVAGLISDEATRATVIHGLQKHRLAHFACHGNLEPGKPFEASFELHGGDRLTLLDIVRLRLAIAPEFAFLSACHTAEHTDLEHPDEALHLTAAVQYCGFRSVVGTLWAMADTDGRDLSAHFYGHMFSPEGEVGLPLCERSARALRDAVQKLRKKKGVTLERWVNFVHYGA